MILLPFSYLLVGIPFLFEKEHLAARSNCQGLTVEEDHLAEILGGDALEPERFQGVWEDGERVALTVKTVNLIFIFVVETFVREIFVVATQNFV